MPRTVRDVVSALAAAYPPHTAQSWDAVGLVCGDPQAQVKHVLLAVDPVEAVVVEAEQRGADLIVVHHPLLLRGIHTVAADTPKGRVLHRLIRSGIALYAAHTNADAAQDGVNDALADLLGLQHTRPLEPLPPVEQATLVTYVPAEHLDVVIDAASAAGAGRIGEYDRCAWQGPGTGTFVGGEAANPVIGRAGVREQVAEHKLEMVLPADRIEDVAAAVRAAHPYEEAPIQFLRRHVPPARTGIGRVGTLPRPCTLRELAETIAAVLPATAQGIRVSGDPAAEVRTVALCGGAGDSLFASVRAADADVYLTSDLRHHPASEAREHRPDGRPYLIDTAHWASEWPWLPRAAEVISASAPEIEVTVSTVCTDPWTLHIPTSRGES